MLKCPCLNCRLVLYQNRKNMHCHLLVYGIDPTYNPWVSHRESIQEIDIYKEGYIEEVSDNESDEIPFDDMASFVLDAANAWRERTTDVGSTRDANETPLVLQKLMEDMEADLYPGCKTFKRLEFIMTMLYIKVTYNLADKAFSLLMDTLHRTFNYDNNLPSSSYKAKNYTKA
ncbi:Netrin-1 [Bienertia sinuspersici]